MHQGSSNDKTSHKRGNEPFSWRRIALATILVIATAGLTYRVFPTLVVERAMLAMQWARVDVTVESEPSYWGDKTPQLRALSDAMQRFPQARRLKAVGIANMPHSTGTSLMLYDRDTGAISRVTRTQRAMSISLGYVHCESWKPVTDAMVQAVARGEYPSHDAAYWFQVVSCK